jgi:hypothetical protein
MGLFPLLNLKCEIALKRSTFCCFRTSESVPAELMVCLLAFEFSS